MKKIYTSVLVLFSLSFAFANPVNNSVPSNGNWKVSPTWSLGRIPVNGDTVVIPAGKIVVIDDIQNLGTDVLFIKIYGTLKLTNGKLWLGDGSTIVLYSGGTITSTGSSAETIKMGGILKYQGNDGPLAGPMFANNTTGTVPLGFVAGTLPVKFIGFDVARQNNNVLLQWSTAQEINSSYFEIQRSENGNDWITIGSVIAAGNSSTTKNYSYLDKTVSSKTVYYRIRQVDIDGRFAITTVRVIKLDNNSTEIRINSTGSNGLYVHFSEQVRSSVVISIINLNGQVISSKTVTNPVGEVLVPYQTPMKGIYVVTVTNGQEIKQSKQVLL